MPWQETSARVSYRNCQCKKVGAFLEKCSENERQDPTCPYDIQGIDRIDSIKLLVGGTKVQRLHYDSGIQERLDEETLHIAKEVWAYSHSILLSMSYEYRCRLAVGTDKADMDFTALVKQEFDDFKPTRRNANTGDPKFDFFEGMGLVWNGNVLHAGAPVCPSLIDEVEKLKDCIGWNVDHDTSYNLDDVLPKLWRYHTPLLYHLPHIKGEG